MFSVLFEVQPRADQWDAYLDNAKRLRPELEKIDGFVDNIRYRSLTREGWLLSLSNWRDEKALVRWRTHALHHGAQEKGRSEILRDYHLRVGQVTHDTCPPDGQVLQEQRLDETKTGAAKSVTLVDTGISLEKVRGGSPDGIAEWLGLDLNARGLIAWDVFEAVLTPGDAVLLMSWRDQAAGEAFKGTIRVPDGTRLRRVRVVRDYGMYDRREAPQFYPAVDKPAD
jgi:heme-degrading monooxygenase HmoA